jgi:hypothetical protein
MAHHIDGKPAAFFTRVTDGVTIPMLAVEDEPQPYVLDSVTVMHIQRAAENSESTVDEVVARLNKGCGYTPEDVETIVDSSIAASFKAKQ